MCSLARAAPQPTDMGVGSRLFLSNLLAEGRMCCSWLANCDDLT